MPAEKWPGTRADHLVVARVGGDEGSLGEFARLGMERDNRRVDPKLIEIVG